MIFRDLERKRSKNNLTNFGFWDFLYYIRGMKIDKKVGEAKRVVAT